VQIGCISPDKQAYGIKTPLNQVKNKRQPLCTLNCADFCFLICGLGIESIGTKAQKAVCYLECDWTNQ
jgi:hypothetical protein